MRALPRVHEKIKRFIHSAAASSVGVDGPHIRFVSKPSRREKLAGFNHEGGGKYPEPIMTLSSSSVCLFPIFLLIPNTWSCLVLVMPALIFARAAISRALSSA